jgi:hypothetical protein
LLDYRVFFYSWSTHGLPGLFLSLEYPWVTGSLSIPRVAMHTGSVCTLVVPIDCRFCFYSWCTQSTHGLPGLFLFSEYTSLPDLFLFLEYTCLLGLFLFLHYPRVTESISFLE